MSNFGESASENEKHQLHPCRVYKAAGFDDDDLRRPSIGIANAFSDVVPKHFILGRLPSLSKKVCTWRGKRG